MQRLRGIRETAAALIGLTAVTLTALHQQAADLYAVPDRGDPLFSIWRMAWVRHQIVTDPRHLFDANIFFPLRDTLTYSDSMILPALVSAPLSWAHIHPVVAYNLMLLAAFVLSGVAAYWLARDLDMPPLAAWVTGAGFALSPFRMNHFSHLELQWTMWMPIVLLTIHRVLGGRGSRVVLALVLGLVLAAQWYSSMYYGMFLSLYAAVFALVLSFAWKASVSRTVSVAAAFCLAGILIAPLARAYVRSTPERGVRSADVVGRYSAVPADYLRPGVANPAYRAILPRVVNAERALFPGIVPMVLAVAGAWPPLSATRAAFLAGGMLAFDGSLGLHGVSYPSLYRFVSPFQSVRVPARFAILVMLTLAVLAGFGTRRLLERVPGARGQLAVTALITAGLLVDAWPRYDRLPMWLSPPGIYASLPATGAVLFEFPVHRPPDRFAENLPYMYFSTWHWSPMVNGYSGFNPPSYAALLEGTSAFPNHSALTYLAGIGVTHVAVHCRLWEPDVCASATAQLDQMTGVHRVARGNWYDAPSSLYELR